MDACEPVLSDRMLRERVQRLAGDLPAAILGRLRIRPARKAARGDLSTDAALLAASVTGCNSQDFARRLAADLRTLPGIGAADLAGSSHVNLRYSDAALAGILVTAATRAEAVAERRPTCPAWVLPLAALDLSDPLVAIQYAHARCRSVLRAARATGEFFAPLDGALPVEGAERRLLCCVEHWLRIGPFDPKPRSIVLYMRDLSDAFEHVWKYGGDGATLRFLYPGDPGASRAGLALVSATADVISTGLALLGIKAAEELQ